MTWKLLADLVLVVHAAYVLFVVGGLTAILAGHWRGWGWVRNGGFRYLHLAAIGVVVAQAWLGVECPLTTLENTLRNRAGEAAYQVSFIQDWLHRLLFYQVSGRTFVWLYTLFGLAVLATWWWAPPARRGYNRRDSAV